MKMDPSDRGMSKGPSSTSARRMGETSRGVQRSRSPPLHWVSRWKEKPTPQPQMKRGASPTTTLTLSRRGSTLPAVVGGSCSSSRTKGDV